MQGSKDNTYKKYGSKQNSQEQKKFNSNDKKNGKREYGNKEYGNKEYGNKGYNSSRGNAKGDTKDKSYKNNNYNRNTKYSNKSKAEETLEDVKQDIVRIEKEIRLEIEEIKTLKLGL